MPCPGPGPPGVLIGPRVEQPSPGTMPGTDVWPVADSWLEWCGGCALRAAMEGQAQALIVWPLAPGFLMLWVMGTCHLQWQ